MDLLLFNVDIAHTTSKNMTCSKQQN